ncbi:MAG: hypothetical protein ACLVJH_08995 [Faecalibacterium prausnitzii]
MDTKALEAEPITVAGSTAACAGPDASCSCSRRRCSLPGRSGGAAAPPQVRRHRHENKTAYPAARCWQRAVLALGAALWSADPQQTQKAEQAASVAAEGSIPLSSFAAERSEQHPNTAIAARRYTLQYSDGSWHAGTRTRPIIWTRSPATPCAPRWRR